MQQEERVASFYLSFRLKDFHFLSEGIGKDIGMHFLHPSREGTAMKRPRAKLAVTSWNLRKILYIYLLSDLQRHIRHLIKSNINSELPQKPFFSPSLIGNPNLCHHYKTALCSPCTPTPIFDLESTLTPKTAISTFPTKPSPLLPHNHRPTDAPLPLSQQPTFPFPIQTLLRQLKHEFPLLFAICQLTASE